MKIVKLTIDWVLGQCFASGNLRSSVGSSTDKLVHWCHGAPGAVYLFIEAYKVSFFSSSEFQIHKICYKLHIHANLKHIIDVNLRSTYVHHWCTNFCMQMTSLFMCWV